jgi:hypothetical protein
MVRIGSNVSNVCAIDSAKCLRQFVFFKLSDDACFAKGLHETTLSEYQL